MTSLLAWAAEAQADMDEGRRPTAWVDQRTQIVVTVLAVHGGGVFLTLTSRIAGVSKTVTAPTVEKALYGASAMALTEMSSLLDALRDTAAMLDAELPEESRP